MDNFLFISATEWPPVCLLRMDRHFARRLVNNGPTIDNYGHELIGNPIGLADESRFHG